MGQCGWGTARIHVTAARSCAYSMWGEGSAPRPGTRPPPGQGGDDSASDRDVHSLMVSAQMFLLPRVLATFAPSRLEDQPQSRVTGTPPTPFSPLPMPACVLSLGPRPRVRCQVEVGASLGGDRAWATSHLEAEEGTQPRPDPHP